MIQLPKTHRILVVDDEPDLFAVTKLSLRTLKYNGHGVELIPAASGQEAIAQMRAHPATSVILLDVVMETQHAGLDACRAIRQELGNRFVRILLRTGQPGVAPEKQAIDEYDIDGYLLKTELTTTRLYAAVRTALKAYEELLELERHRELLKLVHDCMASIHSFDGVDLALQKTLAAAREITGATLAVLSLATCESHGDPISCRLHLGDDAAAEQIASQIQAAPEVAARVTPGPFGIGTLIPLRLYRDLGRGWIYFEGGSTDAAVQQVLPMLSAHAANLLYATVAQQILESREGPFYDSIGV